MCMYTYICFPACYFPIQAIASDLRSQITTLQAALERAREEIAASKEHEAILTSQFQVCLCCCYSEVVMCHI